jgi:hypothetical protein
MLLIASISRLVTLAGKLLVEHIARFGDMIVNTDDH